MSDLFAIAGQAATALPDGFYSQLQPASWRGIGFSVLGSRLRAGRRLALHEYPFRDGVWVEDLGKRGRIYGFEGFLLGDDVADQAASLVEAIEQDGDGELVHPTFGNRQCRCLSFDGGDEWDAGRVWRFRAEFLEPVARGLQLQPDSSTDTADQVAGAADEVDDAVAGSYQDTLPDLLDEGVSAIKRAQSAVRPYVQTATTLAGDASRVVKLASQLDGNFGRYAKGSGTVTTQISGPLTTARQVESAVTAAVSAASSARSAVVGACGSLSKLVGL